MLAAIGNCTSRYPALGSEIFLPSESPRQNCRVPRSSRKHLAHEGDKLTSRSDFSSTTTPGAARSLPGSPPLRQRCTGTHWFVALGYVTAGGRPARALEKIARNPTNRESWWWPTTRSGSRRLGPYRSASRRGRQFCPAALRISSFSIMRFLVSPREAARWPADRSIDRIDPIATLRAPQPISRRESAPAAIKAVPRNRADVRASALFCFPISSRDRKIAV